MTEQKIKTPQEIYSRDGIMIYRNGFRIAECENEEAAENILNHLQSPQEVSDIEIEEMSREYANQYKDETCYSSVFLAYRNGLNKMRSKLNK